MLRFVDVIRCYSIEFTSGPTTSTESPDWTELVDSWRSLRPDLRRLLAEEEVAEEEEAAAAGGVVGGGSSSARRRPISSTLGASPLGVTHRYAMTSGRKR